ncbi:MAG: DUF3368 domain-containing protein [Planctomycetota bacterium]|nr:MAG: DUF3368 domain-containing protein [Planctomycetota bacterium]
MRGVSDTSPLCYLVLIGEIHIVPELFTGIVIPPAVRHELADPESPAEVREWIAAPPSWLSVREPTAVSEDPELRRLDPGERDAIALAEELSTDLLLLDDWKAREVARARGLPITGLVGILDIAVERSLVDAATAVERLRATNFRVSDHLLEMLLRY